jgi:transposase
MKKQRRFSREFKQEAVRLIEESGKSVAEIAAELGVSDNSLYRWRQEFRRDGEQAFPGQGRLKADDEYVRQLEQELKIVKQERDILKKAVSIFSKGPSQ